MTSVLDHTTKAVSNHHVLESTSLRIGRKFVGKVRDVYTVGDYVVVVTTDRLSAFDRLLACVPFKGQVLNMTSAWWFQKTRHIVPNHIISIPHPNVAIVRRATTFKVEFVVRAYLTGSTGTSIWVHYEKGSRNYCGNILPEGMKKNQPLPHLMLTPTTKDDVHDRPISPKEVITEGLMTQDEWDTVSKAALGLFEFGQKEAVSRGLILVDTKYEFGRDALTGEIMIIDEMHTPDSSRYWIAESYEARLKEGKEPENIDKEFLRIWFRNNCDPYADAPLPDAPKELVAELSKRYIQLYETITGEKFSFPAVAADGSSSSSSSSSSLSSSLQVAVADSFPPAPVVAKIFATAGITSNSSPESILEALAAAADAGGIIDQLCNTSSYKQAAAAALKQNVSVSFPVQTHIAIESDALDIFGNPTQSVDICKAYSLRTTASSSEIVSKSVYASIVVPVAVAGGDAAVAAAQACAAAEFVRRQVPQVPTLLVLSSSSSSAAACTQATLAKDVKDAGKFLLSLAVQVANVRGGK